jgi:hypothetical protein
MTAGTLVALALVTGASMVWAMTNVGAQSRVIGLHVRFIDKGARTWKAGHQAARWVILPTIAAPSRNSGITLDRERSLTGFR